MDKKASEANVDKNILDMTDMKGFVMAKIDLKQSVRFMHPYCFSEVWGVH